MPNIIDRFVLILSYCLLSYTLFGQVAASSNQPEAWSNDNALLPLISVLEQLKTEKKVFFLYEPVVLEGVFVRPPASMDRTLKKILKEILPPVGLKYKKVGQRNYVIKKAKRKKKRRPIQLNRKPPEIKLKTSQLETSNYEISGTLRSEMSNELLVGGTVWVNGTSYGTTTDEHGYFALSIPKKQKKLSFSYIGYQEKEIEITGTKRLDITLKPASKQLDEIVVTAVGIEANKRYLGYAIDNIEAKQIAYTGETNLVASFSAKSAGVWINTASGSPGASSSILIRGFRSINGSNKPLFILDGIPVDNTTTGNSTTGVDVSNRLIDLNTFDIESLNILKGASATALYGIRAANGAVIINTKKGQLGGPKVRYRTSFGWSTVNKLPARQNQYTQGKFKNGRATYMGPEEGVNTSYGPNINTLEFDGASTYPYDRNGRLVNKGEGNGKPAIAYDPYKTFFVFGQKWDHNLSVSGGSQRFNYYVSGGYAFEKGVTPRSNFRRYSLKGTFDLNLIENLSLGLSTNLTHSGGFRMKRGSLFSGVPLGLFRNPISFDIGNGLQGMAAADNPNSYLLPNGDQRAFRGNGKYDNPFWTVNLNPFEDKVNRIIQSLSINYQITAGLTLSYKAGLDHYVDNRYDAFDLNAGSYPRGYIELNNIHSTNFNSDLLLFFEKRLSTNWFFKATLGNNFYARTFSLQQTSGEELKTQRIYKISNTNTIRFEESMIRKQLVGWFGELFFRYKHILYLNLSGRNDWSSTLPKDNNAFFYPSFNMGLEFTEWFGLTDSDLLSYGKLRASVSMAGNDAAPFLTQTYFDNAVADGDNLLPGVEFPAYGANALERSSVLGNPDLKAETTFAYEWGLDLKLWKGKFDLSFSWYKTITKDQIVFAQISAPSGYLSIPQNAGTIENKGIEIDLGIKVFHTNEFKWKIDWTFTKFNSIVTELPLNIPGITLGAFTAVSSRIMQGQPYGMLVGTAYKRDQQGRKIIGADGFPLVDERQVIIGNPNPNWLMGIRNNLSFKNIELSFLWDIRHGGDIWNGTRGVMSYLGVSKESGDLREVKDFVFEGVTEDGAINQVAVDFANPENSMGEILWRRYGFLGLAETNIEDGSWVRLRELTLAYHFQPAFASRFISNVNIALTARNLLLFTKYSGVDPETNLRGDSNILGWDYFNLPSTKGWQIALDITF